MSIGSVESTGNEQVIRPLAVRPWAPRAAIAPHVSGSPETSLTVQSNGSKGCYGGWELVYPAGRVGTYFRIRVKVRWTDLAQGFESLSAEVKWEDASGNQIDWAPIRDWEMEDGWVTLTGTVANRSDADQLIVKLLIRWSPTGRVEWKEPELFEAAPPPARTLRLGAATAPRPQGESSIEKNRDRYVSLCRQAALEGVSLLCLPEVVLSWGLPGQTPDNLPDFAVEVPGPQLDPFCRAAGEFGMAICLSVLEREEELVFNTAVLIDESGRIAAKYRKVHLAPPGEVWKGVTPGDDFLATQIRTADAVVGMNICMDSSAAESARAVARLGAEVLLLPIMGDHRADRWTRGRPRFDVQRWMMIQQMRAMDNHIYLVAARNEGIGSGVFAPDGTILTMNGGDRSIVWADIDLADLKHSWTGATFKDICWFERRESTYGVLAGDLVPRLD